LAAARQKLLARDRGKHSRVCQQEVAHDDDHADATDLRIDSERERRRLIDAIRLLPEERQQLVVLKFVQQLQNAEIGQIMNRSEGAIKSLYHRTLAQLRLLIEQ